jgi:hypothetical protein
MQPGFLLQNLHTGEAAGAGFAHMLILELRQRIGRIAANARGLVLLKNDAIILREDFQLIPLGNVQHSAQLNG